MKRLLLLRIILFIVSVVQLCCQCDCDEVPEITLEKIFETFPYAKLLSKNDKQFEDATGISMSSTKAYNHNSLRDIASKFNIAMIEKSFVEKGNFQQLYSRLVDKINVLRESSDESIKNTTEKVIYINILFVGGSVCCGHHAFRPSNISSLTANDDMLANAHLSWPRRFTLFLNFALHKYSNLLLHDTSLNFRISPRYCCRQATSTTHAIDVLKSAAFQKGRCQYDVLKNEEKYFTNAIDFERERERERHWVPDMILWDYSINDLNNYWFKSRPRLFVYEHFVRTAITSFKCQVVDLELINHISFGPNKNVSFMQRKLINQHYNVPMIDYMNALNVPALDDDSLFYAEKVSHRHPAWPTHIIWGQLVFGVVFSGLFRIKSNHFNFDIVPPQPFDQIMEKSVLCGAGFSSYFDFNEVRSAIEANNVRDLIGVAPFKAHGPWLFGSDVVLEPMKTGWLYCEKSHAPDCNALHSYSDITVSKIVDSFHNRLVHKSMTLGRKDKRINSPKISCYHSDNNFIVFRCSNISEGNVKMEYIKSYGKEWSRAVIQTNIKYKSKATAGNYAGKYIFPSYSPIEVDAQWSREEAAVSISQEIELSLQDMHKDAFIKLRNDIDYIDVLVRVCTGTGMKFKILSISCC